MDEILNCFQSCFSRKAAFHWFVMITMGLMLRSDHLGVTSIIRDLPLRPTCYETMLHFFRASSWSVPNLRQRWFEIILCHAPLYKVKDLTVLIGDGVKQAKEGRFMPGVKKLFQESENSSKPEYIHGHMFGGLGVLAGDLTKWFCIPLSLLLHDGLQPASSWEETTVSKASHVVQMIENGYQAARTFGDSLFLLDRYFLSVPALKRLDAFCYHFWSNYMPKPKRYRKKNAPHPFNSITAPKARRKILKSPFKIRYMRTPSKETASEAIVMYYLRKHIFRIMAENPELSITQIIQQEQEKPGIYEDLQAS